MTKELCHVLELKSFPVSKFTQTGQVRSIRRRARLLYPRSLSSYLSQEAIGSNRASKSEE